MRRLIELHLFRLFSVVLTAMVLFTASTVTASPAIDDLLKQYLRSNFPWAEVEISDMLLNAELPGGLPERIIVEKAPPGKTVFALFFKNGKKITATADIKAFDRILVSRRAFRKGYALQEDDFYETLMDVTRIPIGALKNVEEGVTKVLVRSIGANMPITDSMLSEATVVKKGHRVRLVAEYPGLSVSTKGEIRENGRIGDYVKAVNLSSKKVVSGLLIDESTVKVDF